MSADYQKRMFHSSEHRIMRLLDEGSQSFENLLINTWGIYPRTLKSILGGLENVDLVKEVNGSWELTQKNRTYQKAKKIKNKSLYLSKKCFLFANKQMDKFRKKMPEPHPRNYDWRFSNEGLQSFVEYLLTYHSSNDNVCIIAAPSIFVYLNFIKYFDKIILIERSEIMIEKIKDIFPGQFGIITHDLQYPLTTPIETFSCIIADPPWYQDYYELFLSRAKDLVKRGGLIHLALFPPFAKKSALRERTAIFSFAQNNGIDLIELKSGLLKYDTPYFEHKVLEAEGSPPVNSKIWRRGDLATFYVSYKTGRDNIIQVEKGDWSEFIYEQKVILLRHKEEVPGYESPKIKNVIKESPYFHSVNRKHPLRNKIDLWTSGMQAYEVEGSRVIQVILKGIIDNKSMTKIFVDIKNEFDIAIERIKKECVHSYDKLIEILKREKKHE